MGHKPAFVSHNAHLLTLPQRFARSVQAGGITYKNKVNITILSSTDTTNVTRAPGLCGG